MQEEQRIQDASPFKQGAPPPPPGGSPFGGRGPPRPPPRGPPRGPGGGVPIDQLSGLMPSAGAPRGTPGPLSKPVMSNAERQRQMIRKAEKRKLVGFRAHDIKRSLFLTSHVPVTVVVPCW